jgi:hypothetical protein
MAGPQVTSVPASHLREDQALIPRCTEHDNDIQCQWLVVKFNVAIAGPRVRLLVVSVPSLSPFLGTIVPNCPRRLLGHRGTWLEEGFPSMNEGDE